MTTALTDPENVAFVDVDEHGDAFDDPSYRALLGMATSRESLDLRRQALAQSIARTLEHRPGGKDHPQENHGRWSAANRARTAARELEELARSIAGARARADERRVAAEPAVSPRATPTRMSQGAYTKLLKDEHARLLALDGVSEKDAKAATRAVAAEGKAKAAARRDAGDLGSDASGVIDELKERNKELRKALRRKGIDYRTEEQKRTDDAEKNALLDEVEKLARADGHDPAAKRAGASKMSPRELRKFVEDVEAYQKRQAEKRAAQSRGPVAEAAWRAAEDSSLATSRQVGYIMGLLRKRAASGEGGGFMIGPTTSDEVRKMSKGEAGAYINSLRGDY